MQFFFPVQYHISQAHNKFVIVIIYLIRYTRVNILFTTIFLPSHRITIYTWTREAGLHQEGPFQPKFKAQGPILVGPKQENEWRRTHLLIRSSPTYPLFIALEQAAMALNLTNSFLQRPISTAVAPPKTKVLSPFSSLVIFPRRRLFISISPNFGVISRNLEREVTGRWWPAGKRICTPNFTRMRRFIATENWWWRRVGPRKSIRWTCGREITRSIWAAAPPCSSTPTRSRNSARNSESSRSWWRFLSWKEKSCYPQNANPAAKGRRSRRLWRVQLAW